MDSSLSMVEKKLDALITKIAAMHVDLQVHIARDEAMWVRVERTEQELKELTRDSSKLNAKVIGIAAVVSTALGSGISVLSRMVLP